jgi:putative oxidoreductase
MRTDFDLALLSVRIGLAAVFMFHGAQKLFSWFGGHGLEGLIKTFGPVVGTLVGIGEFFGGLGLLVGLLSRFSGASLILIMAGAIYNVHGKKGFSMQDGGYEYNFVLITMALAILLAGPGRIALARFLPASLKPWVE